MLKFVCGSVGRGGAALLYCVSLSLVYRKAANRLNQPRVRSFLGTVRNREYFTLSTSMVVTILDRRRDCLAGWARRGPRSSQSPKSLEVAK